MNYTVFFNSFCTHVVHVQLSAHTIVLCFVLVAPARPWHLVTARASGISLLLGCGWHTLRS